MNFPQSAPSAGTNSYVTENAFPGVTFLNPMTVAVAPGETNRLYVLERSGRIAVITNLANELTLVDRMQDALSGEMTRRQELLRDAGN